MATALPPLPPYEPPPPDEPLALPAVRVIGVLQPLSWLVRGFADLRRCAGLSLLHGLALALIGLALVALAHNRFWLLAGSISGFLVVAPVLATSFYALSRALERGEPADLGLIIKTWMRWQYSRYAVNGGYWSLVRFGLLLGLAATGWVLTSAALITLLAPAPVQTPADFLRHVELAPGHYLFERWLTMGGLMAAPLFASSVIAMPLLLDRRVNVLQAVLASWQAVLTNPVPLALWAALIMVLTAVGMATAMLGLIVILPVLGHASWHAYRDLLDTTRLPERLPPEVAP